MREIDLMAGAQKLKPTYREVLGERSWPSCSALGLIQQLACRHFQRLGDLVDNHNGWVANTALDAADVRSMQAAVIGKALLREALVLTQFL